MSLNGMFATRFRLPIGCTVCVDPLPAPLGRWVMRCAKDHPHRIGLYEGLGGSGKMNGKGSAMEAKPGDVIWVEMFLFPCGDQKAIRSGLSIKQLTRLGWR